MLILTDSVNVCHRIQKVAPLQCTDSGGGVCAAQHPELEAAGVYERRRSQVVVTAAE